MASEAVRTPSPDAEETIQLFVKNVTGQTTTVTVPKNSTISQVKSLISAQQPPSSITETIPPPTDLRLVYAGKHLTSPHTTLSSLDIGPDSTLHLALPLAGGATGEAAAAAEASTSTTTSGTSTPTASAPSKSKKPRCSAKGCGAAAQRIVGDCGFCGGKFCGKHRLLESHGCEGLEDCKRESHERNKERLEGERTKAGTGVC